jgi:hypothetical protein
MGRIERRCLYALWMASPEWRALRAAWLEEWRRRHRVEPTCVICDGPWTLRDDLHHRSYVRLGTEVFEDLLPMHRSCHEAVHRIWEHSPAWRKLGWSQATVGIAAILRQAIQQRGSFDA